MANVIAADIRMVLTDLLMPHLNSFASGKFLNCSDYINSCPQNGSDVSTNIMELL